MKNSDHALNGHGLKQALRGLWRREDGASGVQYTLLLGGIVVLALISGDLIGIQTGSRLTDTADQDGVADDGGAADPDENLDDMPDAFAIDALVDQLLSTRVTSGSVGVTGFDGPQIISITGDGTPRVAVNGGSYGTSHNISPGDSFTVQVTTSDQYQTDVIASVLIGSYSTDFVATTWVGPDHTPDAFSIAAVDDALLSAVVESETVAVTGFEGPIPLSVSGQGSPEVSVNGGAWGNDIDIDDGDSFRVRLTSASTLNTAYAATVTLGTASVGYTVTTNNCPATVQSFSHTGALQTYMVPTGCKRAAVAIWGAGGGGGGCTQSSTHAVFPGGAGGYATADINLIEGETLNIVVGGGGNKGNGSGNVGGYGEGGNGLGFAGGGGGYSGLFRGSENVQGNALVVAGGGGGGGAVTPSDAGSSHGGGPGGGVTGAEDGGSVANGTGASASAGGSGGVDATGGTDNGGDGTAFTGGGQAAGNAQGAGGGGGGYYGGGGGGSMHVGPQIFGSSSGGGGSGYIKSGANDSQLLVGNADAAPFSSHTHYASGAAAGGAGGDSCTDGANGLVILDFQGVIETQETNLAPNWITPSGTLLTTLNGVTANITLSAADPEGSSVTYSVASGTIPFGLSLNGSTGVISGTVASIGTDSGTFTIAASDGTDSTLRSFTIASRVAASCLDYAQIIEQANGSLSSADDGVYNIDPDGDGTGNPAYDVWCDMGVDGGGWEAAVMLADVSTKNHYQTGNTTKITSVTTGIATKGQIGDVWADTDNRDLLMRCWSTDADIHANYNPGFVIYDYEKADIGYLTQQTKQSQTFSSKGQAARSFAQGNQTDFWLACTYSNSSSAASMYHRPATPEGETNCASLSSTAVLVTFFVDSNLIGIRLDGTAPYGAPAYCTEDMVSRGVCSSTNHSVAMDTSNYCVTYIRESQGVTQNFPPIWQTDNSATIELAADYLIDAIQLSASDADSGSLTYAVDGSSALPVGLALSASGEITGTPTTPGEVATTINVTDGTNTIPRTFTFNVEYPANCSRHRDELIRVNGSVSSADNGARNTDADGHAGVITPYSVYCEMATDGGGWELATVVADTTTQNLFSATSERVDDATSVNGSKGDITLAWDAADVTNKDILLSCISSTSSLNDGYHPGFIIYDFDRANIAELTQQSRMNQDSGMDGLAGYSVFNDHSWYMHKCFGFSSDTATLYLEALNPVTVSGTSCPFAGDDGQEIVFSLFGSKQFLATPNCALGSICYDPSGPTSQDFNSTNYCRVFIRDTGTADEPPIWQEPMPKEVAALEFRVGVASTAIDLTATGAGSISYSLQLGSLPPGVSITSGQLVGTPITAGEYTFTIRASDSGSSKHGDRTFRITVDGAYEIIGAGTTGDPRTWEDLTVAASCDDYRNPTNAAYSYAGQTGDGIYTIDPSGSDAFDVYCDMTIDGGGWTRVAFNGSDTRYSSNGQEGTDSSLATGSTSSPNKLADSDFRLLATNGAGEYMIRLTSTRIYILRPDNQSAWSSYASTDGWTNQAYDSKNSSGSWISGCNGHFNTRGFSTYSDNDGGHCPTTFAGAQFYRTMHHTSYPSWSGHNIDAYIR